MKSELLKYIIIEGIQNPKIMLSAIIETLWENLQNKFHKKITQTKKDLTTTL